MKVIVKIKRSGGSLRRLLAHIYRPKGRTVREVAALQPNGSRVAGVINGMDGGMTRVPRLDASSLAWGVTGRGEYLSASTPEAIGRTWKVVMDEISATKHGATRHRYKIAWKDPALELIDKIPLLETKAEHFLKALRIGTVSTNNYLRRLHNFALAMNWLTEPIVPIHPVGQHRQCLRRQF